MAERLGLQLRPPPRDHAGALQLVEPGLHGASGDTEPSRGAEHPDARLVREQMDQSGIELVHRSPSE
jgi:hypothetical protein